MKTKNEILNLCKENNLNFLHNFVLDYCDYENLNFDEFVEEMRSFGLDLQFIDRNVHIYDSDLWDFAKEDSFNDDFIGQAISEGLYDPACKNFSLASLFQVGHYLKLRNDLNDEIYKLSQILKSDEV